MLKFAFKIKVNHFSIWIQFYFKFNGNILSVNE